MAVTIIADPTSFDANSYVTVAMADDYFNNRLNSDSWTALSNDNKGRALIEAANRIEAYRFHGSPAWPKQRLKWPRVPFSALQSGTAQSGSTTTLIDTSLANIDIYDPSEFVYAGLRIIEGTNEGYTRLVTAFNISTGQLTVGTAFPSAIDSTSQYMLVTKIPDAIRQAQCELALWVYTMGVNRNTGIDPNIKSIRTGDWEETYRDELTDSIVPDFVRNMLDEYISTIGQLIDDRTIV